MANLTPYTTSLRGDIDHHRHTHVLPHRGDSWIHTRGVRSRLLTRSSQPLTHDHRIAVLFDGDDTGFSHMAARAEQKKDEESVSVKDLDLEITG